MLKRIAMNEDARDLVHRVILEIDRRSLIENVVAFLAALDEHPDRDRLQNEMIEEWYLAIYKGDYRTVTQQELYEKIFDQYRRFGSAKRLSRKRLREEVGKWFWMEHRVGFYRAF
ncbi:hypothetical protein JQ543_30740 [Bradyrhizobium diazoefficiens]|nr:hypothetical protein [Bradyrhizobium diazoefficiens]MBR0852148.1 hypothetical protein [Bradyrhizobium diazoefficiens]